MNFVPVLQNILSSFTACNYVYDFAARCFIRLYKHDVLNIHQEVNRSKEPKLKFEFNFSNEDFCGLERGEHYDKNGQRRYVKVQGDNNYVFSFFTHKEAFRVNT